MKFLLATTDPQKLPVTVLSRCLQFNLKRLDEDQIQGQMTRILAAEEIEADGSAIVQLAKAADGSLRDGLSLLDQAIAYAGGALREDVVRTMLGTVDRTQVAAMLDALAEGDGPRLLQVVAALAEFSPDWVACWKRSPKACTASRCSSWCRVPPSRKAWMSHHSPSACARKWCSSGTRWP